MHAPLERLPAITPWHTGLWIWNAANIAAGEPEILYLSRAIVRETRERDPLSEALAIADFVQRKTRYTNDPRAFEVVFGPVELVRLWRRFGRWGEDCDTLTATTAALLLSIGHTVRLHLPSFDPRCTIPEHIFVETKLPGGWYAIDPAEKRRTGQMLGDVKHSWFLPNI